MRGLETKEEKEPPAVINVHLKAIICDARGTAGPLNRKH